MHSKIVGVTCLTGVNPLYTHMLRTGLRGNHINFRF